MVKVLIVILVPILITIPVVYTLWYADYSWNESSTVLPFKTWLKFYEIAPGHWNYNLMGPRALYYKETVTMRYRSLHTERKRAAVTISYSTAWQYIIWKHRQNKMEHEKNQVERDSEFFEYVKEDINDLIEDTKKLIKK